MPTSRIIYIPGLGDSYDFIRRIGLMTWRRSDVSVTLVPMRWRDMDETFDAKLARIKEVIDADTTPVVLVGESAGGAMVIVATDRFRSRVAQTITLCGMNQGAENVNPDLYRRNPAFRAAMIQSDKVVANLSDEDKAKMSILYSSRDFTVKPKDTLIAGVKAYDLKIPGHMVAIFSVLFVRSSLITKK